MKISIGSKIIDGPFGGGNEFLKNLISYLNKKGHIVINHLNDKDIDIILLTNPLISSETSSFNSYDIEFYLSFNVFCFKTCLPLYIPVDRSIL